MGAVAPCEGKGAGEAAEAPRGLRASEASKREAPASEPDGSNSEFSPSERSRRGADAAAAAAAVPSGVKDGGNDESTMVRSPRYPKAEAELHAARRQRVAGQAVGKLGVGPHVVDGDEFGKRRLRARLRAPRAEPTPAERVVTGAYES